MAAHTTTHFEPHNKKTEWSGKVLWPLWSFQILATLGNLACYIFIVTEYARYGYWYAFEMHNYGYNTFLFISTIIFLVLNIGVLGIIGFEITRYRKRNLPSKTMLKSQIILSTFSTICMIIEIPGVCGVLNGGSKIFGDFITTIIATVFFWGSLVYTLVIYRRRKTARAMAVDAYGMAA